MADDIDTDRDLDALLSAAARVRPSDDLLARVLTDAQAVQAQLAASEPMAARTQKRAATSRRLWRDPPALVAALGGWGGFGGVTAAGIFGLAVGFWSPEMIDTWGANVPLLSDALAGDGWTPDFTSLALEANDV